MQRTRFETRLTLRNIAIIAVVMTAMGACEPVDDAPEPAVRDTTDASAAAAAPVEVTLLAANGAQVGISHLTQRDDGVEVHVRVSGLEPGSEHGIHFHETGACEGPAFASAGAHFNPTNAQHGLENPQGPHAGDMPNLRAGGDGVVDTTFVKPGAQLRDGASALQQTGGLALVVHAQRDDQVTDPSGDSGDRIACGIVQVP